MNNTYNKKYGRLTRRRRKMDIRYDNMFDYISKKYKYKYLNFRPQYGLGTVATNYVDISGVVVRKHKRVGRLAAYCEIEEIRKSGEINTIKVWNIPRSIMNGTRIRVIGRVKNFSFYTEDNRKKQISGVQASIVIKGSKKCNCVCFIGKIIRKYPLRHTPAGYRIMDMVIKVDGKEEISTIAFDRVADKCVDNMNVGEMVWCKGLFLSRMYEKERLDGSIVRKCTTEVSIVYIEKLG